MELHEAISQIRSLLTERDEIDRKLSELIALGVKATVGARRNHTPGRESGYRSARAVQRPQEKHLLNMQEAGT
jgi:alkylhydroperoxidase/carboxymuconolactone decarboxylase family protein YurZ